MEERTLKIISNYLNTNIYSYLETSGGQSYNLYLNVVIFFNTCVNLTSVAASDSCFLALVSITCCSIGLAWVSLCKCFNYILKYSVMFLKVEVTLYKLIKPLTLSISLLYKYFIADMSPLFSQHFECPIFFWITHSALFDFKRVSSHLSFVNSDHPSVTIRLVWGN
jgi:hypothetical protein